MSDDETREQPEDEDRHQLSFYEQQVAQAQECHDRGIDFAYSYPQNIKRGLEELEKAIRLRESVLGKFHTETSLSYFRKACLLRENKDFHQALLIARRELRITHRLLGGDNSDTPVVEATSEQWWLLERIQWIQEVLFTHKSNFSEVQVAEYSSDLLRAMEFERLGDQRFSANDFDLALDQYDTALGIESAAYAHCPLEVGDLYFKIGNCFAGMRDYDSAIKEYNKAETKYRDTLGTTCRVLGQLYQSRGEIFLKQQNFDDALGSFAKAYNVFEETLGKHHALTTDVLADIRLVTVKEMEELRKAERLRQKQTSKHSCIKSTRNKRGVGRHSIIAEDSSSGGHSSSSTMISDLFINTQYIVVESTGSTSPLESAI